MLGVEQVVKRRKTGVLRRIWVVQRNSYRISLVKWIKMQIRWVIRVSRIPCSKQALSIFWCVLGFDSRWLFYMERITSLFKSNLLPHHICVEGRDHLSFSIVSLLRKDNEFVWVFMILALELNILSHSIVESVCIARLLVLIKRLCIC